MRICEISHQLSYESYRTMAAEMSRLSGDKALVIIPANWVEDFHGTKNESKQSKDYLLHESRAYFNWQKLWGSKHYHLFILSPHIITILKKYQPDFIILDTEACTLLSFEVTLIRNLILPKTNLLIRSCQNIYKRFPFPFNLIEKFVMGQLTAMMARCAEIKEVLRQKGFRRPIYVMGFAVDTDRFSPEVPKAGSSQPFQIGYVGSLIKSKGVNLLIEAVEGLNIPFKLAIVGNGKEIGSLKAQAARSPKCAEIHFTETVPNHCLPEIMRRFDVVVVPSVTMSNWKEQFGRVIIEAMSCGVPVIGSNSGAIPEVVGDGGMIFREGDPKALLACLEKLASDKELLNTLGNLARKRVLEEYSAKTLAKRTLEICQAHMESVS